MIGGLLARLGRRLLGRDDPQGLRARDVAELLQEGAACHRRGDLLGAEALYEVILDRQPEHPDALNLLAVAALTRKELDAALELARRALASGGDVPEYLNTAASILDELGRRDEALEFYRRAALGPLPSMRAHSNLLFFLNSQPDMPRAEVSAEHRRWAERYAEPLTRAAVPHIRSREPERRLKIGYVSADFRTHVLSYFVAPLLGGYDRERFHVTCYASVRREDAITARLRPLADCWRDIRPLEDAAAARLIRDDGIDILVDLSGHSRDTRLGVFARRPAPLQVTYWGYVNTTGLGAIDYRITDAIADPPGATERYYAERLVRLPHCQWCYEPPPQAHAIPVNALPALKRAFTFGSFNKFSKLNDAVIDTWARVLLAVPGSRLVIAGVPEGSARARFAAAWTRHGIAPERIELAATRGFDDYLRWYNDIDLSLDTFPYSGGTVTCESLWMGVPVLTLATESGAGRNSASLLVNAGLGEYVVTSQDDYVARAVHAAGAGLDELALLRAGLRERMRGSPVCDAGAFMRDLESAYRGMWREWCGGKR